MGMLLAAFASSCDTNSCFPRVFPRERSAAAMACGRELSPIPELLQEYEDSSLSEVSADRRASSPEDEGYASETRRLSVDQMLDELSKISRRVSLPASDDISIDEALHSPVPVKTGAPPTSRFDRKNIAGDLESFWTTVRQEVSILRSSYDQAQADSVVLLEEVNAKSKEVEEKDAIIAKLKAELASERKAGRQLQDAMEDLLAWVETNQRDTCTLPAASPVCGRKAHYSYERMDNIPTFGIAFQSKPKNEVVLWRIQVVECYDSQGQPVYYRGSQLPKTLRSYIKFLQFWSGDRHPVVSGGTISCLWCNERGLQSLWHKGSAGLRPCVECTLRQRHCFAVVDGVVRCLPIKDISDCLRSGT